MKKFRIPKSREIEKILKESHDNKNHCGIIGTKLIIDSQNLYWIDMMNHIKIYIKNCLIKLKMLIKKKKKYVKIYYQKAL